MITEITAQNLKGRTFSFQLEPLTIVTGPNGKGKTSVADALTLALLGYHPNLGKTNVATMQLASSDRLEVGLKLSTGEQSKQTWTRKGKAIKKEGGLLDTAAPLLQSILTGPHFLSANASQRAAMIRSAAGAGAEDPVAVLTGQLQASGPLAKLWGRLPRTKASEFAEWLEDRRDAIKDEITASKAVVDRMAKTIQGLAHLNSDDSAPTVTRDQLTEARNRLAHAEAAVQTYNLTFDRLARERDAAINKRAAAEFMPITPTEATDHAVESLKKQIAEQAILVANNERDNREYLAATRRRNALIDVAQDKEVQLSAAIAAHNLTPSEARALIAASTRPQLDDVYAEGINAHEATEAAQDLVHRLTIAANDAAKTGECTRCQSCGAARKNWDQEKRDAAGKAHSEAQANLAAAKQALAAAALREKEATEAHAEAVANARRYEAAGQIVRLAESWERTKAELEATPAPTAPLPAEEVGSAKYELENELEEVLGGLAAYDLAQRAQEAQNALERHSLTRAAIDADHAEAARALAEIQEAYDKGQSATAEAAKLIEAQKELDDAKKEAEEWKALQELLGTLATDLARKSLEPILQTARHFTDGLLPTPLGARGLEIGRWDGEQFVALDVFSGSEKQVALAGLTAALASNGGRILILDEFSQLDDDRKTLFLEHLACAIADGLIQQALVLDNRKPDNTWNIHHINLAA